MYNEYFKLNNSPFKNIPDPSNFYFSEQHEAALIKLFYTILENKGSMLLTGECGCGKTLVSRIFYQELRQQKDRYRLVLIDNPHLNHLELLNEILHQLGENDLSKDKGQLLQKLNQIILGSQKDNKKVIVVVDEAQHIQSKSTLEEIRLLLNHHQNNDYLLTLVLIGQPEFQEIIKNFPQLDQRIAVRHHLRPFSFNETLEFVDDRLSKCGASRDLFQKSAIKSIHNISRGIPRLIINYCDQSLMAAFSQKKNMVDHEVVSTIIKGVEIAQ